MAETASPTEAATANPFVCGKEIAIRGKLLRLAKLRHEWCDFLDDPTHAVEGIREGAAGADLLTFVQEIGDNTPQPYHRETMELAVLPVTTYEKWWDEIGYKTRNKLRKGLKSGVELRVVQLDEELARGLQEIYNESPVRQGRKFYHYGKSVSAIQEELSSFLDRSYLVGAYFNEKLVGFMKLFAGANVLRTVHIIAKIEHRDKNVMDILIAKGVELCAEQGMSHFQYGSWTDGGIGVFREKHGFQRMTVPRYYAPITLRGALMLRCNLHRPVRQLVPDAWVNPLLQLRAKWNTLKFGRDKVAGTPPALSAHKRGGG